MSKTPKTTPDVEPTSGKAPVPRPGDAVMHAALQAWGPLGEYWVDATQRTLLFWDVLRQRSDQYYAQKAQPVPNVLSFDAELVSDGRTFERPANYLLVRVKPPKGVTIDLRKRPFVVVDPRAGHGPGIGGFKADSELGVAMRAGHPCYFVGFTPDPMPGQTIEDIMRAEARFLEQVIALHPQAEGKPCVIGNCQDGWAVLTPKATDAVNPDLVGGDWIVRFEPRTLDDVRAIVQPDPENERRFATVKRVSEINLGLYRTLFQPFVQAFADAQKASGLPRFNSAELPYELFSDRNPLMRQIADLAEQVRQQRQPAAPDNPFLQLQAMISEGMIAALDGWRDLRDRSLEEIFLATYSSPLLQALVGIRAEDAPPRHRPGVEPERLAFIQQRIGELKARLAEGGVHEAAIRSLVYIGLAGPGIDERAFNVLREIRSREDALTLDEFKQVLREQFFSLLLDQDEALAAIPGMLPTDTAAREQALAAVREVVSAAGEVSGERAARLARIEALFAGGTTDAGQA